MENIFIKQQIQSFKRQKQFYNVQKLRNFEDEQQMIDYLVKTILQFENERQNMLQNVLQNTEFDSVIENLQRDKQLILQLIQCLACKYKEKNISSVLQILQILCELSAYECVAQTILINNQYFIQFVNDLFEQESNQFNQQISLLEIDGVYQTILIIITNSLNTNINFTYNFTVIFQILKKKLNKETLGVSFNFIKEVISSQNLTEQNKLPEEITDELLDLLQQHDCLMLRQFFDNIQFKLLIQFIKQLINFILQTNNNATILTYIIHTVLKNFKYFTYFTNDIFNIIQMHDFNDLVDSDSLISFMNLVQFYSQTSYNNIMCTILYLLNEFNKNSVLQLINSNVIITINYLLKRLQHEQHHYLITILQNWMTNFDLKDDLYQYFRQFPELQ